MTDCYESGRQAYYAGMPYNKNPYIGKLDMINKIKCSTWSKGFRSAEKDCKGV